MLTPEDAILKFEASELLSKNLKTHLRSRLKVALESVL
jgi:hypothetical protein